MVGVGRGRERDFQQLYQNQENAMPRQGEGKSLNQGANVLPTRRAFSRRFEPYHCFNCGECDLTHPNCDKPP